MSAVNTRRAFKPNWLARLGWLAVIGYCVLAIWSLDITLDRFVIGLENGAKFLSSMIPPNFERWKLLLGNLLETLRLPGFISCGPRFTRRWITAMTAMSSTPLLTCSLLTKAPSSCSTR